VFTSDCVSLLDPPVGKPAAPRSES
jgi:hypothetical protein